MVHLSQAHRHGSPEGPGLTLVHFPTAKVQLLQSLVASIWIVGIAVQTGMQTAGF